MSITPTVVQPLGSDGDNSDKLFTWALTTAIADGIPIDLNHIKLHNCCIQATGTWGGATMTWQGSNDNTNWFTCTNVAGSTNATLTSSGGMQIIERPLYMRPNLTVAGSSAAVTVTAYLSRSQPGRV